jgi:predicted phosphodiesterase
MASILVLSDTHFGLGSSTLTNHKQVDCLIWEVWRYGKGCGEIVLLGDIFDLWQARPERAFRDSRYLFERLSDLDVKISYVVGNHDHHFAVMSQEMDFLGRVARGDIYSVYTPNLNWSQTLDGLNVDMYYPIYKASSSLHSYLFTHGHHLKGVQAFSIQLIEQLRKLSGEEISPADLEMMMAYAYEGMYRSSYIGEMVDFEQKLWKVSCIFNRMNNGIHRKYPSVERQYDAILEFLRDQRVGKVDCFVYGDTHKAGIYRRDGGPMAVNAGSLTSERRNGSTEELPDTYIVIDDDCVTVRQLGREEPLFTGEHKEQAISYPMGSLFFRR